MTTRDWTALQGDPLADETLDDWAEDMARQLARMTERGARTVWNEMTEVEQDAVAAVRERKIPCTT